MIPATAASPNILLVDDSPQNLAALTQILSEQGYRIRQAIHGEAALTSVRAALPDLILLDIRMPGMSGYDVCQQLKADELTRTIPIVFISALDDPQDKIKAFEVGGVDYVTKPFQIQEVVARVKTHVALHQLQEELHAANRRLENRILTQTETLRVTNAQLCQEIEERKQAEADLRTLNEELELRVWQRTAELERINRELRDFAHIVSHDLKAPLRGVMNLARWLIEDYADRLGEQGAEMCDLLRAATARLNTMIDGILRYSRVGYGGGEETAIDLNLLLPELITLLAPPPQIQIRVTSALPTIQADPVQIGQIFQNLLSNAIKFSDKPQGEISVSCEADGRMWVFRILDNGVGIAPQYYTRIFQLFQTGAARENAENTGIGLAIVKKLVEGYGGSIWIESTVGVGSTFAFTLPRTRSPRLEESYM